MNETQAERLIAALERIAESLEKLEGLTDTLSTLTNEETGEETTVLNVWKEGETPA